MQGTVKLWKGSYGFVTNDETGDIFVHQTGVRMSGYRELVQGQAVEFEMRDTERGRCAYNVTVIGEPE